MSDVMKTTLALWREDVVAFIKGRFKWSAVFSTFVLVGSLIRVLLWYRPANYGVFIEFAAKAYGIGVYYLTVPVFWLPNFVEFIAKYLPWEFHLFPNWRDMLVVLTLYLSSHIRDVKNLQSSDRRKRAFRRRLAAAVLGLALAIVAGTVALARGTSPFAATIVSACTGIVVYRIGFAIQFALDLKEDGRLFWATFKSKVSEIWSIAIGSFVLIGISIAASSIFSPQIFATFAFVLVLAAIQLLALFHIRLAVRDVKQQMKRNTPPKELQIDLSLGVEARKSIEGKGNYKIGVSINQAFAGAIIVLISITAAQAIAQSTQVLVKGF